MIARTMVVVAMWGAVAAAWAGVGESSRGAAARAFDESTMEAAQAPAAAVIQAKRWGSIPFSEEVRRNARHRQELLAIIGSLRTGKSQPGAAWSTWSALPLKVKEEVIAVLESVVRNPDARNADLKRLDSLPLVDVPGLRELVAHEASFVGQKSRQTPDSNLIFSGDDHIPSSVHQVAGSVYQGMLAQGNAGSAFSDSAKVGAVLNQLADNDPAHPSWALHWALGPDLKSVPEFVAALRDSGHSFVVKDMRYFANFPQLLDFEAGGPGVVTPVYLRTGLTLPSGAKFDYPVVHSQIDIQIRGPVVNADLEFYFGIDGAGIFYPKGERNQSWVGGRAVETATGERAMELVRRAAVARRELRLKAVKYGLPNGGYGPLGVCDDVDAMITGNPVYPQIRDMRYYRNGDGMAVDAWAEAQPVDNLAAPTPERVYESLPVSDPAELSELPATQQLVKELKAWVEQRKGAVPPPAQ